MSVLEMNVSDRFSSKDVGRRFGIHDEDLKTPGHDALLLWVNERADKIVRYLTLDAHCLGACEWEKPIGGSFIVGYWDVWMTTQSLSDIAKSECPALCQLERQYLQVRAIGDQIGLSPLSYLTPEAKELARANKDAILAALRVPVMTPRVESIGFEIKTSIPSLGELVRQLQTYRERKVAYGAKWMKTDIIVVVSTDDRWQDAIASQGFRFINPEKWHF
jgi:hypothetical protein